MKKTLFVVFGLLLVLAWITGCCRCGREQDRQGVVRIDNERFFSGMKPYLRQGYEVLMVPKGRSMLPTIQDNTDQVTLKALKTAGVGDVVLAEIDSGHYVMHRIVKIHGDQVILKGDHNKGVEHTYLNRIIAKMVDLKPGLASNQALNQVHVANDDAHYRVRPHIRLDSFREDVILVDTVRKIVDMHHLISFNEAAKLIWDGIERQSFTLMDMVRVLMQNYEVDSAVAKKDCATLLDNWAQYGLVEEEGQEAIRP